MTRRKFREITPEDIAAAEQRERDAQQERTDRLLARGYDPNMTVVSLVVCRRCGSIVPRNSDMLDVHDRWHETTKSAPPP